MTKLNQRILEMIRDSEGHLTAEEALILTKEKNISISIASIYRFLGKLADEGYIRRVSVPGQPDVFDKTMDNHGHFVCSVCGKVKDLMIRDLKEIIYKETGITCDNYDLSVTYICPECKKANK